MIKLLLASLLFVVIIFGFQTDAETQTTSPAAIQPTNSNPGTTRILAFNSAPQQEQIKHVEEADLRLASTKAIKLIQHSQTVWYKKQTCTSCHHQLLPAITFNLAGERGIAFNEMAAREMTTAAFTYLQDLDMAVQGYDYIDVFFDGWALTSASLAGVQANLSTAAYAQFIASRQLPDGSWPTIDSRPPQAHSAFAATAVCAQAIRHYLPARLKAEQETRVRQSRAWFLKSQPRTTEDRAFQLLGLFWTGADEDARQQAARALLSEQRDDGGWAQLPGLTSDAYSTGQVLFALRQGAGSATGDAAYQRGLRFLLKNQQADGSWRVKSRLHPPAPVSPPYVDTEFPEQHDQFISIMGTSWAVNALLNSLPLQAGEKLKPAMKLDIATAEQAEWAHVALNGSAEELKKLLDNGMKPDARTAAGTTALMFAAHDIEKVKLLLARGADVNARAASGITALMVAARYRGNAEVVRLLLKKGARPNADKGIAVRNHASALMFAVMAGDTQSVRALVEAGARQGERMELLGQFGTRPLLMAAAYNDPAMIEFLIGKGSNPNEIDDDNLSALSWATLTNHAETVQALLAGGAKVNHVDKFGMTPLLYAASIDFGDHAVIEKLIAAGADLKAKNKQGQTALDLAKTYNHSKATSLLTSKIASR